MDSISGNLGYIWRRNHRECLEVFETRREHTFYRFARVLHRACWQNPRDTAHDGGASPRCIGTDCLTLLPLRPRLRSTPPPV
jgi:hypothetical protein